MKKYIVIILATLFLTGCYDYLEVNELAIVDALGIDYKDNTYYVSAQVLGVKKDGGTTVDQIPILYTGEGKSLAEAIYNMNLEDSKYIYLGHLNLIVYGKDIINNDVERSFDYLIRDPHIREETLVIASTKNTAFEILNQKKDDDPYPSISIVSSINEISKYGGQVIKMDIESFIKSFLKEGITPVVSTIELIEREYNEKDELKKYNSIRLGNIAVIKDKKVVDELPDKESIAYNIINNNIRNIMININFKEEKSVVEVFYDNSKIDIDINGNNIDITIDVRLSGNITETTSKVNVKSKEVLEEYNKETSKVIKDYINNLIDTCREKNYDVLGLKNLIYKKYPKKYNYFKDKNIYEVANIKVKVDTNVYKEGNIYSREEK